MAFLDFLGKEHSIAHASYNRWLVPPAALAGEHVGYGNHPVMIALAWSAVGIPLAIGIWITLQKALILFR